MLAFRKRSRTFCNSHPGLEVQDKETAFIQDNTTTKEPRICVSMLSTFQTKVFNHCVEFEYPEETDVNQHKHHHQPRKQPSTNTDGNFAVNHVLYNPIQNHSSCRHPRLPLQNRATAPKHRARRSSSRSTHPRWSNIFTSRSISMAISPPAQLTGKRVYTTRTNSITPGTIFVDGNAPSAADVHWANRYDAVGILPVPPQGV